jgi:hypothetical protein
MANIKNIDRHNLRNYAVLVRFTAKKWGITRKDNSASDAVVEKYGTEDGMAQVHKHLINPKTPEFKAIAKHLGLAGNVFRGMAGPWDKAGFWIISTKGYSQLQAIMQEMETKHDQLVDDFAAALPRILAEAATAGGQLYDPDLIPTVEEIREKFVFSFETEILPDRGNTILDLDEKRAKGIADAAEATTAQRYKDLTAHLHERVRHELTDALANLREYGDEIEGSKRTRSFKDGMVERLRGLCDLLPALNIEGDPKLDKLAQDIASKLTMTPAATLRGDRVKGDKRTPERRDADAAKAREVTADAAEALLADLGSVFGDAA